MLQSLFQWLDLHPGSYWIPVAAATLLLVLRLGFMIGRDWRRAAEPRGADWRDAATLSLFLFAWRWPFLFTAHEFNPDESQLIAGAAKLAHDPVFWRAVDGGSSGPFNFYVLVPWAWAGAPLDYFTARLTGLLLVAGALFLCLRALARLHGRTAAWLAVLPAAGFFATVTHPELIHYSTEHLPLLLIAAAASLLARCAPAGRRRLATASLLAGVLPWTKLQAAPIALALLGWAGWQVFRAPGFSAPDRRRRTLGLLLAAALPSLLLAGMALAAGEAGTAVRRYLLQNLLYVGQGTAAGEALSALWRNARMDGRFPLFLGTVAGLLLAAGFWHGWKRVRLPAVFAATGFVSLAAVIAVIAPRREFLHYVLLLPVPLTLCVGAAVGPWWNGLRAGRTRLLLGGSLLAAGLLPLATRLRQPLPEPCGRLAYEWRHPRSGAAAVLRALAGPHGTLAVWGWAGGLYVESGLIQAARDGNTLWSIVPGAQQDHHRAAFLADLTAEPPDVFADAVGQGAFTFDYRTLQAHENFPALGEFIARRYTLVVDLLDVRLYARNDLPGLGAMTPERVWELVGRGREPEKSTLSPPSSSIDRLQHRVIAGRTVIMLLPPARVEWRLDDDVRAVSLEFGFDPAAYERGQGNGAELLLEINSPDTTHPVYQRFLDPIRQPGDRGLQSVRVALPTFAPGSQLILRTDPGQYGDAAWDWVYLAGLKLYRQSDPEPK